MEGEDRDASNADEKKNSGPSPRPPQEQPWGFSKHRALEGNARSPEALSPRKTKKHRPEELTPRKSKARARSPGRKSSRKRTPQSREEKSPHVDDEGEPGRKSPRDSTTPQPEITPEVTRLHYSLGRSPYQSPKQSPRTVSEQTAGQSLSPSTSYAETSSRKSRQVSFSWVPHLPSFPSSGFQKNAQYPFRSFAMKPSRGSTVAPQSSGNFVDQTLKNPQFDTLGATEVPFQSAHEAESPEHEFPVEDITQLDYASSHSLPVTPSSSSPIFPQCPSDSVSQPHLEHLLYLPRQSQEPPVDSASSTPQQFLIDVRSPDLQPQQERPIDEAIPPPQSIEANEGDPIADDSNGHIYPDVTAAVLEEVAKHSRLASVMRQRKISSRFFQTPLAQPQQIHTWKGMIYYAYQTLGIVYGDLGTSPLYVYPTIQFKEEATEKDYLGILSVIFWTLTLVGVVKYTLIVLKADDHGEGGTFATYSILCQYANIHQHRGELNPINNMQGQRISHFYNMEEKHHQSRVKLFLERSDSAQKALLFIAMMATCMLIGDGILTPAISVISAIEGIRTAVPNMSRGVILVISTVILVLLFLLQRFGTQRVSMFFSPIMAAWFVTTPMVGVYNIAKHYPRIFKAFSPTHLVEFFKVNGKNAWVQLGGTVLCITGAEAMYADMGHFNKRSIQFAFCVVVYPSVLLTYSGQTSYLIRHPEDHSEGFFKMIPTKVFWPMFVISTLAAVVASQGLISATFSVVKQSVALDYFPRVKLVHTSDIKEGQIYSPEINYILMALCLAVLGGFRSSATIGNAFGVAVVFVMTITTCLMSLVMLIVWGWTLLSVLPFLCVFLLVEVGYIGAVVTKVPQGGWLPFVVAVVVTLIMVSWNMGCRAKYKYELNNQISRRRFLALLREVEQKRVPGICFFFTDLMLGVPPIVQHYIRNVRSLHHVLVFTTVRFLPVKTVLPSERFLVGRAGFDGVYRCVARYGYRDVMNYENNEFMDQFLETLKEYIQSTASSSAPRSVLSVEPVVPPSQSAINAELQVLETARKDGAVYVMGRGDLQVTKDTKFLTRVFVGTAYRFLRANCRSSRTTMNIPIGQYLEIGMVYHI